MKTMKIVKSPSPNRGKFRGTVSKAVLHHTGSSGKAALAWLINPKSKVSANYLVMETGLIYELVNPQYTSWANGIAIPGWTNGATITIEIANHGDGKQPYADEQYKAVAYLLNVHAISKENVRDHKSICIPKGRKKDMSANFDFNKLFAIAYGGGAKPQASPSVESFTKVGLNTYRADVTKYGVVKGKLYKVAGVIALAKKWGLKIWNR